MNLSLFQRINPVIWEVKPEVKPQAKVRARIIATPSLLKEMEEGVLEQLTNLATLPGVVDPVWAMPDAHWGYGAPIGGVFATDPNQGGVISPGAVGFDINCGIRLMVTQLEEKEIASFKEKLVDRLFAVAGAGVGGRGPLQLNLKQLDQVCRKGAGWAVSQGFGRPEDLSRIEEGGFLEGADPAAVSSKAKERGRFQLGSLGSGNHYLEIQKVDRILNPQAAEFFGLKKPGQITVMIHCGSRGFGHQIATDYLYRFNQLQTKEKISLPDRQLACAPAHSSPGKTYFASMAAAANFAFANRQILTHQVRTVFAEVLKTKAEKLGLELVYDVSHNVAKWEKGLLVHRKGATRAFGPGNENLPPPLRKWGQPVLIGGSMETASWLLLGTKKAEKLTFASTCHGSGRVMSRREAKRKLSGPEIQKRLKEKGIWVRSASWAVLAEEAGLAYKDIDEVIKAVVQAGISQPVARFVPVANIKG